MEKKRKEYKNVPVSPDTYNKLLDKQDDIRREKGVRKTLDELINEMIGGNSDEQTKKLDKLNEDFKKQLGK